MKTPKKPTSKSPLVDPETDIEDSSEETGNKKSYQEDEDDFDLPLDDLDGFENFSDDDDDDY